jgi:secernin
MTASFSCDTSVALRSATFDGSTIFAKNSDRAPNEAQPLRHVPGATYDDGATVKCQYISIPQVNRTWEVIGSRPCWLWGFEMGVNEWGVAIGNEAVLTREPHEERALIGMDIVRLALERSTAADEAVAVIGSLIEQYGQGGSCEEHSFRTYHNSYIVADPRAAWIVETAGKHWVAQRVTDRAAIGNLLTIHDSWDAASPGLVQHANAAGWATTPFDFAESYRDPDADLAPRACRLDRARAILSEYREPITVEHMMGVLRDHNGGDLPTGPEPLPTLCMHARPGFNGETAAAMVAHHRPDKPRELAATVWTAFGSPCLSLFRPAYPFAVGLPAELDRGASKYDPESPWWVFERLQRIVAAEPSLASTVRESFDRVQQLFFEQASEVEDRAERALASGHRAEAIRMLRDLVGRTTRDAVSAARNVFDRLADRHVQFPIFEMAAYWSEINQEASMPQPRICLASAKS